MESEKMQPPVKTDMPDEIHVCPVPYSGGTDLHAHFERSPDCVYPYTTYRRADLCATSGDADEAYRMIFENAIIRNMRLHKIDCSIAGHCTVFLVLAGDEYDKWFDLPEVEDAAGNDLRPPLYFTGTGATAIEAVRAALSGENK